MNVMSLHSDTRRIRDLVYATFVSHGRAPSIGELARLADCSAAQVSTALQLLADAHALVLSRDGDAIVMAHPFTAAPMAYTVTPLDGKDERRWWGGCAWDSFGISCALNIDVRIDTVCPHCGAHLAVSAGPARAPDLASVAVRFPRPAAEWWCDVVATCTMIRMFCNREHAEQWTQDHAPGTGFIANVVDVWRLAKPWYGDRVQPDFVPHTREFNQQLLESVGFRGEFWLLP